MTFAEIDLLRATLGAPAVQARASVLAIIEALAQSAVFLTGRA